MNPEKALVKIANIEKILATIPHENRVPTDDDEAWISEALPRFTLMKDISNVQTQIRTRKFNEILLKVESLHAGVAKLSDVVGSTNNIAKHLKAIVDLNRVLVYYIKRGSQGCAIPLSRNYHERFTTLIKKCISIVSDQEHWRAASVKYPEISLLLKSSTNTFKEIADTLDYTVEEHKSLQELSMRMLKQISEINFDSNLLKSATLLC